MQDNQDQVNRGSATADPDRRLSRRLFLKASMTGAVVAGVGGLSGCAARPTATPMRGTTPKAVALYRDAPNQGQRCAGCTHFLEPNACEIVAGEISPNGWCRFFEPIAGQMQESQAQPTGSSGY